MVCPVDANKSGVCPSCTCVVDRRLVRICLGLPSLAVDTSLGTSLCQDFSNSILIPRACSASQGMEQYTAALVPTSVIGDGAVHFSASATRIKKYGANRRLL